MIRVNNDSGTKLDYSKQHLKKLPKEIENPEVYLECNVDDNEFSRLEGFDQFKHLRKLSAKRNRLVKIVGLSRLCELVELDLSENTLQSVENLKSLRLLEKLNLAGNDIKVFALLNYNQKLRHIDLSNNGINTLSDISNLHDLQTLDLSRNIISTISTANKCLPTSLVSLDLSENEIGDLCEISCLHFLAELEYLGFAQNRCVSNLACEYRPFIVNWCYKLKILDGKPISQHERLTAEWLFSQGQGRRFNFAENEQLTEYLTRVCPLGDVSSRKNTANQSSTSAVPEAWVSHDMVPAALKNLQKPSGIANDMQIEDVANFRDSSESTNKIQSESVFLPVAQSHDSARNQEMEDIKILENIQKRLSSDGSARPFTAPSGSRNGPMQSSGDSVESDTDEKAILIQKPVHFHDVPHSGSPLRPSDRPRTSPASASSVTKYEEYDCRPCRPMSKQLMKELFNDEASAQRQQQQQGSQISNLVSKPLVNGRPSPSSSTLTAVPEKTDMPKKQETSAVDLKNSSEKPAVVPHSRVRLRRSRLNVPGSGLPGVQKSAETAASVQSKNEAIERVMVTPEMPRVNDKRAHAAVRIQAAWRGYSTRKRLQPDLRMLAFRRYGNVVSSLLEMRKADAEHIRQLEEILAERDRQERKARRLQTAAIKQLWEQVQSMKQQLAALTGTEAFKTSMLQSSAVIQSQQAPDENVSSVVPPNNGPLSSIVSDSVRSLADPSCSPGITETSPIRRGSQHLDFGITRRSPYAVRQVKGIALVNGSPTKPANGNNDDLGRAAALSPLATPPRTRQTAIGNNGPVVVNGGGGVEGRRMALAAKFSYLPDVYRSNSNGNLNGIDGQSSQDSPSATVMTEPVKQTNLFERVRQKLDSFN